MPEALEFLDPAALTYEEWVEVGMAMHAEGMSAADWDAWSRQDPARHHVGECARKWASFGQPGAGRVAGGTVVQMARDRGWSPGRGGGWDGPDEALEWGAPIVDPAWVEPAEVAEANAGPWDPAGEAARYLEALFDAEDYVGYVTSAWRDDDGKWKPKGRGGYSRTAGELVAELRRTRDVEMTFGTPNPEAGAWVRFNPLNGQGVRNLDVAEFRYALVESDDMDVGRQKAMIDELRLPCACVVHSGGKSLHAIVRVEAGDYAEYRKRVDYLYDVCRRNGLTIDTQNKNPSRLSRLPGFERSGGRQRIVSGPCGAESWTEWVEWIEEADDGLPEIEPFCEDWGEVPDMPDPLVEDLLMPGDKMMLAGPPKAGKSFALIELCAAVASGGTWLGKRCRKGNVLYVNLELKRDSRLRRMRDVATAMGVSPADMSGVHCLDLRGRTVPLDRLVRSIVRRCSKERYAMVVIDPIYKVMGGDESDSEAVKKFCDQLDRLAEGMGCAVVYCHHYAKGDSWQKASIDRASGSGVFSRDADTLLSMTEVEVSEELRAQQVDAAFCRAAAGWLDANRPAWRGELESEDDALSRPALNGYLRSGRLARAEEDAAHGETARAWAAAEHKTAWRIEGTFRELPPCEPIDAWFDHPVHEIDGTGVLKDAQMAKGKQKQKRSPSGGKPKVSREQFAEACLMAHPGGKPSVKELVEYLDVSESSVNNYITRYGAVKSNVGNNRYEVSMPDGKG